LKRPSKKSAPVIGIFAPSSAFTEDRYQEGLNVLRNQGFEIFEPEGLRESKGYLAGSDKHRVELFHRLLEDEQVDIVWAARGGYGLHRILPLIDAEKIAQAQKMIIGFSDICALHALAQSQANLVSIHGPVITQLSNLPTSDLEHLQLIINQQWNDLIYSATGETLVAGTAEGILVGGCLSVVGPLVGTPYLPPLDGSILLLEDVGEASYRIDRLLTHLKLAGIFERISGLGFGDFHACNPRNDSEPTIPELLRDLVGNLNIPVLTGLPFGHGPRNRALPLGCLGRLNAEKKTLTLIPNE